MPISVQTRCAIAMRLCQLQHHLTALSQCSNLLRRELNLCGALQHYRSGFGNKCGRMYCQWPKKSPINKCASYGHSSLASYVTSSLREQTVSQSTVTGCAPVLRQFVVELSAELAPNESLCMTGDARALGQWQLERCVFLQRQDQLTWTARVLLQSCRNTNYRYFVVALDGQGRKQIKRWETQPQPRLLRPRSAGKMQVDRFGEAASGKPQVHRGWLTEESILQFKFEREKMFQVKDIEKFDPENVLIKLTPVRMELPTSAESVDANVNIETVKFKYGNSKLHPQRPNGVSYHRGDVVIFHVTVAKPLPTAFMLVFHTPAMQVMGKSIVRSDDLVGSEGVLELDVMGPEDGSSSVIAILSLPYLRIEPLKDVNLNFRGSYAHYWPTTWSNLDVGHRGNGRSFIAQPPVERENTIASFMSAYHSFADMIELDVHLTADSVPVVYHDFGVRTAPKGKPITNVNQLEYVLIKDLSYDALKDIRVFSVIKDQPVEFPSHNAEPRREHRFFPTLMDVLKALPKTLGIDVEIKWPQPRATGRVDAQQTIDKNFFIDQIVQVVLTYANGRPLLFSSFDSNICAMLRFKQNTFPVVFLTNGETKKWQPYMDLRTRTFEQAINNAQAFELAGTAPHAEDFLGENGEQLLQKAHNLGQITLVWGDDINSKERVQYFGKIGATAICYDRADLNMPQGKDHAFFNTTAIQAEMAISG